MSEIEIIDNTTTEVNPVETVYVGTCESLSGRSNLTYTVARSSSDKSLGLAITGNDGAGMFCSDFVAGSQLDEIVIGATELTSASFQVCHPGRSTNTFGFILAALRDLQMVRRGSPNSRFHEHVPTTTFQKVVMARVGQAGEVTPKPGRRKAKVS